MKQYVLMEKETGELGLAVKVTLTDNHAVKELLANIRGYTIELLDTDYDGYLIFSGTPDSDGPWVYVSKELIEKRTENLGEL